MIFNAHFREYLINEIKALDKKLDELNRQLVTCRLLEFIEEDFPEVTPMKDIIDDGNIRFVIADMKTQINFNMNDRNYRYPRPVIIKVKKNGELYKDKCYLYSLNRDNLKIVGKLEG